MKKTNLDKKFLHRLFLLFIILALPIFVAKEYRIIMAKKDTRILPAPDFFQAMLEENNNKSFVFIVLTKNCLETIDANFHSIMKQKYPNYRVVYIDRDSQDGTLLRLHELAQEKEMAECVSIIETKKDYETFRAYSEAIWRCQNDEVIVHFSGDDWLANDRVLERLDQTYTNPDVWLTYGQYFDYKGYKKGILHPKPKKILYKKRVQRAPWMLSPLKTFYAGHFKKIRPLEAIEDVSLSIENELALLQPLVEMGKAHVQFIPDVLYIHNEQAQKKSGKMKLAYRAEKFAHSIHQALPAEKGAADVILFSFCPQDLKPCLDAMNRHVEGIGKISVMHQADEAYQKLQEDFPEITFIDFDSNLKSSFLRALIDNANSSCYVILASDQVQVQEEVFLMPCIEAMRKTRAHAFYFHLGKNEGEAKPKGIYSWSFAGDESLNPLKMALYRKIDLEKEIKNASFESFADLADLWSSRADRNFVGLSFDHSPLSCGL